MRIGYSDRMGSDATLTGGPVPPFTWVPGPKCGAWVMERLDGDIVSRERHPALGWMVPSGYDALVRILHPFSRERPDGVTWAEYSRICDTAEVSGDWDRLPDIHDELVPWATAATALRDHDLATDRRGLDDTPSIASFELVGLSEYGDEIEDIADDGCRYHLPEEGRLDPATLSIVAGVLAAHTSTPDRGIAAIWDGFGGLTSGQGIAFFAAVDEARLHLPPFLARARQRWYTRLVDFHERRRRFGLFPAVQSIVFRFARVPRWIERLRIRKLDQADTDDIVYGPTPGWASAPRLSRGSGVLSRREARGPRLQLPDRSYVCFESGVGAFVSEDWIGVAPWTAPDETANQAHTPSVMWPEGREWYFVSEIDFDSTLVACSRACADAILLAPGVEAVEIDRDTQL